MKAFVSVDFEGLPHVVIPGQLNLKGPLYEEARKIATKLTLTLAEELHKGGFGEILVADSHGPMVNLLVEELPDYVELIRGYPRPMSMVAGVEGCDAALFLGYHAKMGTAYATFDHTYSGGTYHRVTINGIEASEFLLNAYAAGDANVPVILVAGDSRLLDEDVRKYAPWAEALAFKRSLGRAAARSYGLGKIERDLREAAQRAVSAFQQKKTKPLKATHPVRMQLTFVSTYFTDLAELLPHIKRIDGLTVEYTVDNMTQAYNIFELLALAASGVAALKRDQS
jgi:D-amino peptidase